MAASTHGHNIHTWNPNDRLIHKWHAKSGHLFCIVFSPDSRELATCGEDRSITLWQADTGLVVHKIMYGCQPAGTLYRGYARVIAFSPDGHTMAAGNGVLWDLQTGRPRTQLAIRSNINSMVFLNDQELITTSNKLGQDPTGIKVWNVMTGREIRKLDTPYEFSCLSISPDKRTLACGDERGYVTLLDIRANRLIRSWQAWTRHGGDIRFPIYDIAFSPNGKVLAIAGAAVDLLDASDLFSDITVEPELLGNFLKDNGFPFFSVAFAPDGRTLIGSNETNHINRWRLNDRLSGLLEPEPLSP